MKKDKYQNFSLEEFLSDEYFITSTLEPDAEDQAFWNDWLNDYPEKQKILQIARNILTQIKFSDEFPSKNPQLLYKNIEKQIQETHYKKIKSRKTWIWGGVAATLLFFTVSLFLVLTKIQYASTITHQTEYGETKAIQLPDGSSVTLNANSSLTYTQNWSNQHNREVYLKGEAFFDVKKVSSKRKQLKFIVNTTDIQVEVLGTSFNVNTRRNNTRVVLQEGKVKLHSLNAEQAQNQILSPGEMASFNPDAQNFSKKSVSIEEYISWKQQEFIFNQTPLSEVALLLKENYNYEVIIQDSTLLEEIIVGTFPSDDISILLETLRTSLEITQNSNQLIIKAKENLP